MNTRFNNTGKNGRLSQLLALLGCLLTVAAVNLGATPVRAGEIVTDDLLINHDASQDDGANDLWEDLQGTGYDWTLTNTTNNTGVSAFFWDQQCLRVWRGG